MGKLSLSMRNSLLLSLLVHFVGIFILINIVKLPKRTPFKQITIDIDLGIQNKSLSLLEPTNEQGSSYIPYPDISPIEDNIKDIVSVSDKILTNKLTLLSPYRISSINKTVSNTSALKEKELLNKFLSEIVSRIEKAKHYPRFAIENNIQGRVRCQFTILNTGKLKEVKIIKSSNFSILDNAALKAIRDASPFPSFPSFYKKKTLTSVIEIRFRLD